MKAIFIPFHGTPNLDVLNRELKDCKEILDIVSIDSGQILIVDYVTREDKLKKLDNVCQNNC
jgi:hypothetical protein